MDVLRKKKTFADVSIFIFKPSFSNKYKVRIAFWDQFTQNIDIRADFLLQKKKHQYKI